MRWIFMYKNEIKIASEAAQKVLDKLEYFGDEFVSTDDIVQVVSEITDTEISFSYLSFSEKGINDNYGAMMCVYAADNTGHRKANIILNSDKDSKFMRFSLVHELGHLITEHYTVEDDNSEYTVSAHVKYNITTISEEEYSKSKYLLNEQIANIFALKVLMPAEAFAEQIFNNRDFKGVADFFGVTSDAVRSRALLGL